MSDVLRSASCGVCTVVDNNRPLRPSSAITTCCGRQRVVQEICNRSKLMEFKPNEHKVTACGSSRKLQASFAHISYHCETSAVRYRLRILRQ